MRYLLLCAVLTGCASGGCLFGGDTEEADAICAERNFGTAGAAELLERARMCELCGTFAGPELGADEQYCVLNCGIDDGEEL